MKKTAKIICLVLSIVLILAASVAIFAACSTKVIMIWGPGNHEQVYMKAIEDYRKDHPDQFKGYEFRYAGSGDSGAYAAMQVSVENGAAIYTFANDQTANLANLGALATLTEEQVAWSKQNNDENAVQSTIFGEDDEGNPVYVAYPLQPDNGYIMYINADAFRGTTIWDDNVENIDGTKGNLKPGYTFRQLYAALDANTSAPLGTHSSGDNKKGQPITWKEDGKVMWPMGDSWYLSGVFFSVGGDYEVKYSDDGSKQESARCWFCCDENVTDYRRGDFTVGKDAYECIKNTFTNADNTVNDHFFFPTSSYNEDIETHIDKSQVAWEEAPFAAAMCGTWEVNAIKEAWGDDYRVTVLPTLESDDGELFQMKNFRGYKNLGINPQCSYVMDAPVEERLARLNELHELAQYFCGKEVSLARHDATGAGPANKEALADESVAKDPALQALYAQYDIECVYPNNYKKEELRGQKIGTEGQLGYGVGYRVQDSVPANYWKPIENFGKLIWAEFSTQKFSKLGSNDKIVSQLFNLQTEIQKTSA